MWVHVLAAEGWAAQLEQPADLAAVLLGSLAHCLDNTAALACFSELGWVWERAPGRLHFACHSVP